MLSSIRARLTLWYMGVLALLIVAFALITYLLVSRNLDTTINKSLEEVGRSIETDLRKEEADIAAERLTPAEPIDEDEADEDDRKASADEIPLTVEAAIAEEVNDLRARDFGFVVLDGNKRQIAASISDPVLQNRLESLHWDTSFVDLAVENETVRVHRKLLDLDGKTFHLLITRSLREPTEFLASLRTIFFAAFPAALLLAGLGGYYLARRSLAPVVAMSEQAASIGSSNLNKRLPVENDRDELGSLAKVFNALLARLESSFNQQKQFMADASHELRTPLSIVRGESEVAISKANRPAEEYRESLAIVHDESLRLTKIVEDLFTLARADSGQLKPRFEKVYVDEILADCVRRVRVLAEKKDVSLEFNQNGEMAVSGDAELLQRIFINLLDNAIKYNRDGGKVSIAYDERRISIADTGTGIPSEERSKIFKRFYRVDKARSREGDTRTGGAGLGLSIAEWIAIEHGAELKLEKSDESGSVFTLSFPE